MITGEKARELLNAYQAETTHATWQALTNRAQELAFTVVAQADQIAAVQALVDSYAALAAKGVYELAPVVADLRRVLGDGQ